MGMQILASILLGLIPEVLYFTLSIIFFKNIKEKRGWLIFLTSIAYFLCMFIRKYQIVYYVLFIAALYGILKILYKDKVQKIDIFVISLFSIYLTVISYLCSINFKEDLSNYYILYVVDRTLLFLPFVFKNKYHKLYQLYCTLWNRNDQEKRIIKSITLRNISLIIINIAIVFMNIYAVSFIKFIG